MLNETHDAQLTSWVESANRKGNDFPIQNLPFAVFRPKNSQESFRGGVAIGDQILDLAQAKAVGNFSETAKAALSACEAPNLNGFMAMGPEVWSVLRLELSRVLRIGVSFQEQMEACLIKQTQAEFKVPAQIGDYTDFFTSIHHATNVGRLFRPDNPLLPNYKWVPIAYHGRSSSIEVSGHRFHRPVGQTMAPGKEIPSFGPCQRLDYELELGIYIGVGNELGAPIPLEQSEEHVFGLCLFNDWSARDIQTWEYQPLGPFLAKSFASTVSPWIVTMEALAPYRIEWTRPTEDPQPLPYLESQKNREEGGIDITLEVHLETKKMREERQPPAQVSQSNFRHSYWSIAQMVAHHTVNGCNLKAGDFFGSGTQSGPAASEAGSLLELSQAGKQPVLLSNGESRSFVEDGDAVILRGWCEKPGATRIGFGEAVGYVLPAIAY